LAMHGDDGDARVIVLHVFFYPTVQMPSVILSDATRIATTMLLDQSRSIIGGENVWLLLIKHSATWS
jgi:hypothetical protein